MTQDMSKLFFSFVFLCCLAVQGFGQEARVLVAKDTVYSDNVIEVHYVFENASGSVELPDFEKLRVVGGPNTQSSRTVIGGKAESRNVYVYYVVADDAGTYRLPSAAMGSGADRLQTEEKTIVVLPNPDGLREDLSVPSEATAPRINSERIEPRQGGVPNTKRKRISI